VNYYRCSARSAYEATASLYASGVLMSKRTIADSNSTSLRVMFGFLNISLMPSPCSVMDASSILKDELNIRGCPPWSLNRGDVMSAP